MSRYVWICIGVAMAAASSYLIFGKPEGLPLWLVWLGGSFLGYMGIAVMLGGLAYVLLPRKQQARVGGPTRGA
jgi:hypothetical protein